MGDPCLRPAATSRQKRSRKEESKGIDTRVAFLRALILIPCHGKSNTPDTPDLTHCFLGVRTLADKSLMFATDLNVVSLSQT